MYAYPDFEVREEAYHATHSFTRKFCGCMSLRGGCAMACALWIVSKCNDPLIQKVLIVYASFKGLHLYCAILAFRYSNRKSEICKQQQPNMGDDSLYYNNVAVFSYLNVYALMVFGGVCCAFVVVAIFNLFSLFVVRPSFRYDVY